jgi:hypothetical protein
VEQVHVIHSHPWSPLVQLLVKKPRSDFIRAPPRRAVLKHADKNGTGIYMETRDESDIWETKRQACAAALQRRQKGRLSLQRGQKDVQTEHKDKATKEREREKEKEKQEEEEEVEVEVEAKEKERKREREKEKTDNKDTTQTRHRQAGR